MGVVDTGGRGWTLIFGSVLILLLCTECGADAETSGLMAFMNKERQKSGEPKQSEKLESRSMNANHGGQADGNGWANGKDCIQGGEPKDTAKLVEISAPQEYRRMLSQMKSLSSGDIKEVNKRYTAQYGKSCKSGKCALDLDLAIPVCTSHAIAIKPVLGMVVVILAGSLLRYFQ